MKKFLSIFVAVAMVFSLFAGTLAPRALAAPALITDTTKSQGYWSTVPTTMVAGAYATTTQYVYKMGDIIHGTAAFTTVAEGNQFRIDLYNTAFTTIVDTFYGVQHIFGTTPQLTYSWQLGTGNVSVDGQFRIRVTEIGGDVETFDVAASILIKYNLTWKVSTIPNCDTTAVKLEGWITRGNGQTVLVPVAVAISYPTNLLAATYVVAPLSSGQFTLVFPLSVAAGHVGNFRLWVSDGYLPANIDNDAMVYDTLTNIPTNLAITAATFGSPILLYKNTNGQPVVLSLVDQNGDPVTGATPSVTETIASWAEIAPGYYRFLLNIGTPSSGDVRFYFTKSIYSATKTSNTVIVNLRDLGPFNPYLNIDATGGHVDCETGRYVYDALPCTIGNSLYIEVGYWGVADAANWYIADVETVVNGPVREIDDNLWIIEKAGKITASISMTVWERIDRTCPAWNIDSNEHPTEFEMSANACCHTYEKNFDICEVVSCSLVGVTLENGAQTSATSIEVGDKADLVVNVSGANAPAGLSCGCNTKLVHIYMVQKCGRTPLADAFTLDTYGGTTTTVSELWYNGTVPVPRPYPVGLTDATTTTPDFPWNPQYYDAAGNEFGAPGTVTFAATTPNAIIVDNCEKLTFKGVTFNFPTGTDSRSPGLRSRAVV
jgi:hypothetical protein